MCNQSQRTSTSLLLFLPLSVFRLCRDNVMTIGRSHGRSHGSGHHLSASEPEEEGLGGEGVGWGGRGVEAVISGSDQPFG